MKDQIKNAYYWIKKSPWGIPVAFAIIWLAFYFLIWDVIRPWDIEKKIEPCINFRIFWHLLFTTLVAFILTIILEIIFRKFLWNLYSVTYQTHTQNIGWNNWKSDGEIGGSHDVGLRLEAIRIKLGDKVPSGLNIEYQVHVQNQGWHPSVRNGEKAGTEGQALPIEAIRIQLSNAPNNFSVLYCVRMSGNVWSDWVKDFELAGTEGQNIPIEAIRILVITE
jgi:uncharacterized protein YjdB